MGSIREFALSSLLLHEKSIRHNELRVLAQIGLDKDEGKKAFEEYMDVTFPWLGKAREMEISQVKRALDAWTRQGPLSITPTEGATRPVKSKLAGRVREVDSTREREVSQALRRQLGTFVPRAQEIT